MSDTTFLINLSNQPHLPCVGIAHNNDLVIAFTKLDEALPRADWCLFAEAIVLVVAAIRNVDFSHHNRLLILTTYSRGMRQGGQFDLAMGDIGISDADHQAVTQLDRREDVSNWHEADKFNSALKPQPLTQSAQRCELR